MLTKALPPAVLVLSLIGVSGPSLSASPRPVAPVGHHIVTVPTAGFSIPVPDDWMALDLTQTVAPDASVQFSLLVDEVRKTPHARFFAVSADTVTTLIVQLFPAVHRLSTKEVRRLLARGGYRYVKPRRVSLGEHPAMVASVTQDGVVRPTFVTFYFVKGKRGVLGLTFATLRDGRRDPIVQTMIHGLELSR